MSWLIANWRLKLLALAMAVGLLTVVAFASDPVKQVTLEAQVRFLGLDDTLSLLDIPTQLPVTITGLSTDVDAVTKNNNVVVDVDCSRIKHTGTFTVSGTPEIPGASGVTAQSDHVQVPSLRVDPRRTTTFSVQVRPTNVQAGWKVDSLTADPSSVSMTGPASVLDGLQAVVDYPLLIDASSGGGTTHTVTFLRGDKAVDLARVKTYPPIVVQPGAVAVTYTAHQPIIDRSVFLVANFTGALPTGTYVSGLTVTPQQVDVRGPDDTVSKLGPGLQLPAISLSAMRLGDNTSTVTPQLPSDVSMPQNPKISVTVTLSQLPGFPRPSPSPGGGP